MMRLALLAASLLALAGCASWGNRESTVTLPTGEIYRLDCQQDAQVHFKRGDLDITVDNRGRPGFLEQALGASLLGVSGLSPTVSAGNLLKGEIK